ncbi:MAG: hypothetical protein NTU98_00165 [Bacteroidetes bacterium]|nr:hypothetical protein [Bacteroidota bacterium]
MIKQAESGSCCPCDEMEFPPLLNIPAGLTTIPRQLAYFPEFRYAMLSGIRSYPAFSAWAARNQNDFGIMLLEMWAYICDSTSFYNEVIANECYIRTAKQRSSIRKIAGLTGYLPKPAVASQVSLAALGDGRRLLTIPSGTAFRSGAFGAESPQVFETGNDQLIHPLTNKWNILPPLPEILSVQDQSQLLVEPLTHLKKEMKVLVRVSGTYERTLVATVKETGISVKNTGKTLARITYDRDLKLNINTAYKDISVVAPVREDGIQHISSGVKMVLARMIPGLIAGDAVLISRGTEFRRFRILKAETISFSPDVPAVLMTVNHSTFTMPAVHNKVTRITLDTDINNYLRAPSATIWGSDNCHELLFHYDMQPAGSPAPVSRDTLICSDPMILDSRPEKPLEDWFSQNFLFSDKNMMAAQSSGRIDYSAGKLNPDLGETWPQPLTFPVQAFGNVVEATRGETVRPEILGSGDASVASQSFKLKKKPLTYLFSPSAANDQAVAAQLEIRVNDIRWKEVPDFFNIDPSAPVYVLRQNDDGETTVTFGDGINGQRLPSGKDNVVAKYRVGAGKSSPPEGSITQIASPVKGLQSIKNPLAASGGAEAESAGEMQTAVPKSALTLGRIISIPDVEAVVLSVPGVRAIQVEWRWSKLKQLPLVHIYFIGDTSLTPTILQRLNAISDPNIPYHVEPAGRVRVTISIDFTINRDYNADSVISMVSNLLSSPGTGLLTPEMMGIGKPVYLSRIYETIQEVEGVISINSVNWCGVHFMKYAKSPGPGKYFDAGVNGITLNGTI